MLITGPRVTSAGERKFPEHPESAQEIRFLGKIGFFKPCAQTCPINDKEIRCPRNPIFGKNRIFQTVPKRAQKMTKKSVPKKSDFWEKSDFSNRVPKRAQ
jgi:hypothetical protein